MSVISFILRLLGRDPAKNVERTIAKVDTLIDKLVAGGNAMRNTIAENDEAVRAKFEEARRLEAEKAEVNEDLQRSSDRAFRIAAKLQEITS